MHGIMKLRAVTKLSIFIHHLYPSICYQTRGEVISVLSLERRYGILSRVSDKTDITEPRM